MKLKKIMFNIILSLIVFVIMIPLESISKAIKYDEIWINTGAITNWLRKEENKKEFLSETEDTVLESWLNMGVYINTNEWGYGANGDNYQLCLYQQQANNVEFTKHIICNVIDINMNEGSPIIVYYIASNGTKSKKEFTEKDLESSNLYDYANKLASEMYTINNVLPETIKGEMNGDGTYKHSTNYWESTYDNDLGVQFLRIRNSIQYLGHMMIGKSEDKVGATSTEITEYIDNNFYKSPNGVGIGIHNASGTWVGKYPDSSKKYKARILLLSSPMANAQQVFIFAAEPVDTPEEGSIKIQKSPSSLQGIKFSIFDSNNVYKGELITDSNGQTESITLPPGTYTIKEITNNHYGYAGNKGKLQTCTLSAGEEKTFYFQNESDLGNLQLHKTDLNGNSMEGVKFKLSNGSGYAHIWWGPNPGGYYLDNINYPIEIDQKNECGEGKYWIGWVPFEQATTFITNAKGDITINNLEVYSGAKGKNGDQNKITYKFVETYNPYYGYAGNNLGTSGNSGSNKYTKNLTTGSTEQITCENPPYLGNIKIHKVDGANKDVSVQGMQYKIKMDDDNHYIKLKNVSVVIGTVDVENYEVEYVTSDKATLFETDANGQILINNLEVWKNWDQRHKYTVIESGGTGKASYYKIEGSCTKELEENQTTNMNYNDPDNWANNQNKIDISGNVWLENWQGKESNLNGKYDSGEKGVNGITVYLKDSSGKEIMRTTTSNKGNYKFTKVEKDKLSDYHIEFEYDGVLYQSTPKTNQGTNGSKASDSTSRVTLDSSSAIVDATGGQKVSVKDASGNEKYKVNYNNINTKDYSSSITTNTITANDTIAIDNSKAYYKVQATTNGICKLDELAIDGKTEITNINLGIYEKAQADLELNQDLNSVKVGVNGYWHIYNYSTRQSDWDGNNWNVGVKFANKYKDNTYNRAIYEADAEYQNDEDKSKELQVYLTYKVALVASTYYSKANTIQYYFDNRYNLEGAGTGIDAENNITGALSTGNVSNYNNEYNQVNITTKNILLEPGKAQYLYVQFKLDRKAVLEIINGKETLDAAAEITSYTIYKDDGKNTLAVVDKDSVPGNYKITDTTNEDDNDKAPSLQLVFVDARKIAGTVFVDSTTGELQSGKERLGDGKYTNGEETLKNIKVQLCKANDNSVVKETKTDANGNYQLVGFIPDKYIIKFTWGNETYSVYDYKGTIYNNKDRQNRVTWHQEDVDTRYSDAMDDYALRETIDKEIKEPNELNKEKLLTTIKEKSKTTTMVSTTPIMEVCIESTDTKLNHLSSGINKVEFLIKNVDFGIVKRPIQKLQLDKDVTAFKIVSATGTVFVDATVKDGKVTGVTDHLTYIKDSFIKAEMSDELIQGSTLQITYSFKVTNIGELDYVSEEYYKYGTGKNDKNLVTIKPTALIDYLDNDLGFDTSINSEFGWTKISATESDIGIKPDYTLYKNNLKNTVILKNIKLGNSALKPGQSSSEEPKLIVSKLLTTSADATFDNTAEIISVKQSGGSPIEEFPNAKAEKGIVSPSTGYNKNILYTIVGTISLIILATGIAIIKKKVLKNK